MITIKGSWVALVTPWKDDQLDEEALTSLIHWHCEHFTEGIVVCGSTGEGSLLSSEEHEGIIALSVNAAQGRVPIFAGVNGFTADKVLPLIKGAERSKASGLMVVAPPYIKPTEQGMIDFFRHLHDHTHLPLLLYDNPGRVGIGISDEVILELAYLPRFVGLKDSSRDMTRFQRLRGHLPEDFALMCGEDDLTWLARQNGADGSISVTANVLPDLCARIHQFWDQKQGEDGEKIQDTLMPVHRALFQESNPIPVKYAVHCIRGISPEVRSPLTMATQTTQRLIHDLLGHLEPLS
jgi:4-hydroxy-tetrahydrodipicolinate synthase